MSINLYTQTNKTIEILNADNTFSNATKHPDYWRLIGDVSFKHNNAVMHCDSAYHYSNKNKIKAFGQIEIKQGDSITLTGNKLTYFGEKNKANILGNVVLIDKYMILKTKQIIYNLKSNIASYPSTGKIIDNEKTINSKRGEYNSKNQNFIFRDSVKVVAQNYDILTDNMHYNSNSETTYFFGPTYILSKDKTIYCENGWYNTKTGVSQFQKNAYIATKSQQLKGDSLYFNEVLGYGKVIKNVEIIDTAENITVFGHFAEYFEKEEMVEVNEKAYLQFLFEEDTLFMHAKKFISQQKIGEKKILAYNNVKFFKLDLQGKCDSLSYNFSNNIVEMFIKPIIWSNEFQITSDSIQFLIYEGNIHNMFLNSKPMVIAQEDSLDFNQIKGKDMTAYFSKNKIQKMDVLGNGQSVFLVTNEENNKKVALNFSECTDLTLYFRKNKLDFVNYNIEPKSTTIPYQEVKEQDRYLKGFHWRKSEQPNKKEDIFIE